MTAAPTRRLSQGSRGRLSRPYGLSRSWLALLRQAPGFAPFLPVVWRSFFGRAEPPATFADVPGTLTPAEREWLAAQVRGTRAEAVIGQAGPPEVDVTCALAVGGWASQRRVYVAWPEAADNGSAFRQWHQTVIRQGLAPYVTPMVAGREWNRLIDMLYAESPVGWANRLRPGAVVVRRRPPGSPDPLFREFAACGALVAAKVTSA